MIWWRASSLQLNTRIVLSSSHERQSVLLPGLPLVIVLGPAPSNFIDFYLFHVTFSGLNSQQQRISVPRSAMNRAVLFSEKMELWQWALACLSGLGPCPSWTMKEWTWVGRWLTSLQMMADPLVQLVATIKLAVLSRERWQGSSPIVGTTAKTLKFSSVTTIEPLACSLTMQQQPSCLIMQEGLDCCRTGLAAYSPALRRQTLGEQPPMTTSTPFASINYKQYNIYKLGRIQYGKVRKEASLVCLVKSIECQCADVVGSFICWGGSGFQEAGFVMFDVFLVYSYAIVFGSPFVLLSFTAYQMQITDGLVFTEACFLFLGRNLSILMCFLGKVPSILIPVLQLLCFPHCNQPQCLAGSCYWQLGQFQAGLVFLLKTRQIAARLSAEPILGRIHSSSCATPPSHLLLIFCSYRRIRWSWKQPQLAPLPPCPKWTCPRRVLFRWQTCGWIFTQVCGWIFTQVCGWIFMQSRSLCLPCPCVYISFRNTAGGKSRYHAVCCRTTNFWPIGRPPLQPVPSAYPSSTPTLGFATTSSRLYPGSAVQFPHLF